MSVDASIDALAAWRDVLGDVGALGGALRRAIASDDIVGAVASMFELRRARANLARVEAPERIAGDAGEAAALAEVGARIAGARTAEAAMATWLARPLPGDARLLGSPLGVAVLADHALPAVWDVEADVAIFVGAGLEPVAGVLADLGQRRIVIHGGTGDAVPGAIATASVDEIELAIRTMTPVAPARFVVRGAFGVPAEQLSEITERVRAALSDLRVQRNTVQAFSRTWLDQGTANLPALAATPSIAALDGALAGLPLVIVAPGPSLAANIGALHALAGRAVLACFSHSLKPVLAAGLSPDLVLTVDPQDVRYHFAGCDVSRACLVNAATVHPSLFRLGARVHLTCAANSLLDDWIFDGVGEDARLPGGGSVATTAFSLALRWQCDPIVFVGLDLSFPGGSYYVASSVDGAARAVTDERGHIRVDGWSAEFRAMKAHGGPGAATERSIELPGWHGGTVPSSFMFSMFHRWFVEKLRAVKSTRVYNCTEGGAFIAGMEHRALAGVIAELPARDAAGEATAAIDAAVRAVTGARRAALLGHTRRYARGLARVRKLAMRAQRLAHGTPSAELARAERSLAAALRPLPFVSLLAQRSIERAFDVAHHQATPDRYLAASATLFDALLDVLTVLEPLVAGAAKELAHGA